MEITWDGLMPRSVMKRRQPTRKPPVYDCTNQWRAPGAHPSAGKLNGILELVIQMKGCIIHDNWTKKFKIYSRVQKNLHHCEQQKKNQYMSLLMSWFTFVDIETLV
jgi:hypothetical protein